MTGNNDELFGVAASFADPQDLVAAAEKVYDQGYRDINTYTPYPIEGAWEAIGHHRSPMSMITLIGGVTGCLAAFGFLTWASVIDYPLNVGGRPTFSWPAWIPPTFETTILFAGLSAAIGMFLVNGLPKPYHPMFGMPGFERATQDRYVLCIEATDPKFDRSAAAELLRGFDPEEVHEVAH